MAHPRTEGMYLKNQSPVQLVSYHVINHFINIYDWMPILVACIMIVFSMFFVYIHNELTEKTRR